MSNAVFPTLAGLGWDFVEIPEFSTTIQKSITLDETRVSFTPYPIYNYEIVFDILRTQATFQEYQTLKNFFLNRGGNFDSFLIDNPDDDAATLQVIGTTDGGVTTAFQLIRVFSGGFAQPTYNIKGSPAPILYVGTKVQGSSAYSINGSGLVTFQGSAVSMAGSAVKATFGYYWRVRFEDPKMSFVKFMQYRYRTDTLKLIGLPR